MTLFSGNPIRVCSDDVPDLYQPDDRLTGISDRFRRSIAPYGFPAVDRPGISTATLVHLKLGTLTFLVGMRINARTVARPATRLYLHLLPMQPPTFKHIFTQKQSHEKTNFIHPRLHLYFQRLHPNHPFPADWHTDLRFLQHTVRKITPSSSRNHRRRI